jgi:hypothetical protein
MLKGSERRRAINDTRSAPVFKGGKPLFYRARKRGRDGATQDKTCPLLVRKMRATAGLARNSEWCAAQGWHTWLPSGISVACMEAERKYKEFVCRLNDIDQKTVFLIEPSLAPFQSKKKAR